MDQWRDTSRTQHWRDLAKCAGKDTEAWYPPREGGVYLDIASQSKAVCWGKDGRPPCQVRTECLLHAIERDEDFGIWGGMSHRERNSLIRRYSKVTGEVATMPLKDFIEKGGPDMTTTRVKKPTSTGSGNLRALLATTKRETRLLGPVERWVLSQENDRDMSLLHPSDLVADDFCPRAAWHWIRGDRPTIEPRVGLRMQEIFDEGHAVHERWQNRLWSMGNLFGQYKCVWDHKFFAVSPTQCPECKMPRAGLKYIETPLVSREHCIKGKTDGWVLGLGDDFLLEAKSIGPGTLRHYAPHLLPKAENNLSAAFKEINQPFPGHFKQIQLYLRLTHIMAEDPDIHLPSPMKAIDEAVVLYELKMDQDYREFVITYDPTFTDFAIERANHVLDFFDRDVEPDCASDKGTCTRCKGFVAVAA